MEESERDVIAQRRRDRRTTRIQKKVLRKRRETKQGWVKSSKDQVAAKAANEYIAERREILASRQQQLRSKSFCSSKYEHPSVLGYTLQPVTSKWNARKCNPIFFGYDAQLVAEDTVALLDCKLFGIDVHGWNSDIEKMVLDAVHSEVKSLGIHRGAVYLSSLSGVRGEGLRRTKEKLERRAQKSRLFQTHLDNMMQEEGGGVVNVRVAAIASGTAPALNEVKRFVYSSPTDRMHPSNQIMLDIQEHETRLAEKVCKRMLDAVTSGSLMGRLGKYSLAINFPPRVTRAGRSENYDCSPDTPRKRATKSRRFLFQNAKLLSTFLEKPDREYTRPRYELAKVLHPAHFGRRTEHIRPDIEKVSPIFWGEWSAPQVRDYGTDAEKVHPGFFSGHTDWATSQQVLHRKSGPGCSHPIFHGHFACGPDFNKLSVVQREKTEEEELLEDEAFMSGLRGKGKYAKEEAERAKVEAARQVVQERNRHPACLGYKRRTVPVFEHQASAFMHPACLGYKISPEQMLPAQKVSTILHPSCVGYQLAAEELNYVENSAAIVSPIFFGLCPTKGPRYAPPEVSNNKLAQRRALLDSLVLNPHQERTQKCHICFGAQAHGCPMCWRPESWELDGMKNNFEDHASKTLDKIIYEAPGLRTRASPDSDLKKNAPEDVRATVKLQFKAQAAQALKRNAGLVCSADIRSYREQQATLITVYIKSLPTGDAVRLCIESCRTLSDLYFLYRANAKTDLGNLPRTWIVLATMRNLICFDPTLIAQDETQSAFKPGLLTLKDFGLNENHSQLCMFQIKDLNHPDVSGVVSAYISQNVNLARRLDLEQLEQRETDAITKSKMRRYRAAWGIGLSIKSRASNLRSKNALKRVKQQAKDQLETETEGEPHREQQELPQLGRDIFKQIDFHHKVFRPDQVRDQGKAAQDRLQVILIREMKDLMLRQIRAWQEELVRREVYIEVQRKLKMELATQRRKQAGHALVRKAEVKRLQDQRRKRRNMDHLESKKKRQDVPPLKLPQVLL